MVLGMSSGSPPRNRRSIRLQGYDYSSPGAYFVTICTQNRTALFGEVQDDSMTLNPAGQMIMEIYLEIQSKFPNVKTDQVICMPDHIHFILFLTSSNRSSHDGIQAKLPNVIQWFKTVTTNKYIRGVQQSDWPSFPRKLWQRSYYEHIIRDQSTLNQIRQYILDNPLNWTTK